MPFTDHGSEQPVPPYDNLRAVDWTRLLAEKSQALDHWFYESVQPFVDARCKLLEYKRAVAIALAVLEVIADPKAELPVDGRETCRIYEDMALEAIGKIHGSNPSRQTSAARKDG